MKILIAEWKAWMKWRTNKTQLFKNGLLACIDMVTKDEVELLPEEYKSYTEYREYMKSVGTKKRVYRRKKDGDNGN